MQGVQGISGSRRTTMQGARLEIATYNVKTLLKDEHLQEMKDKLHDIERDQTRIRLGEIQRKEESLTTVQNH